jgi:hypothetical protein
MSTQMSQEYPGEVRREMKSRFDVVNAASEERRRLRRESGDFKDAKAYKRPPKFFIDGDGEGEVDVYDGMGENDSLGG